MFMNRRREFLHRAAALAALPLLSGHARAEAYPQRPVRIIVGFTAGSAADTTARIVAQWLSERLGQQVIVENHPGAGSRLATEAVTHAAPDGYTLLLVNATLAINAAFDEKDTAHRDIVPIADIIRLAAVVTVSPELPVKSIPELIAYAKAHPGALKMASAGIGTTIHLAGELFKLKAGVDMVHVPYRGSPLALADLIAGRVDLMFAPIPTAMEPIKAGRLRGLAVTSLTRQAVLPELPAVADELPGYEATVFFGLGAPRGTPADIVMRLNKEVNMALSQPEIAARFSALGATVVLGSPADFGKLIADETAKWSRVIRAVGIKAG